MRNGGLTDRFLPLNVAAAPGRSAVDVLKCGALKELSSLPGTEANTGHAVGGCVRSGAISQIRDAGNRRFDASDTIFQAEQQNLGRLDKILWP